MRNALARELEAFQHDVVQLSRQQDALAAHDDTLRADFAAVTERCGTLIAQWGVVATRDSAEATDDTAEQRRDLARALHTHYTEMARAIATRRTLAAQGHALYLEWFAIERRVRRLRQSLDRELFGAPRLRADRAERDAPVDNIDTMTLLMHEMRTHLTMALLATDRLSRRPQSARDTRFIGYLMTGLALLQRDLDILDPPLVTEP